MTGPLALKPELDRLAALYEDVRFIEDDPVSVPHAFDDPADREVIGLFAALLAWGRRATILNKMANLAERMRMCPARFVRDFDLTRDGARLSGFKHRTFSDEDAVSLTLALQAALRRYGSIEGIVAAHLAPGAEDIETGIQGLSDTLMTAVPDTPRRLQKHLARPAKGSAAKRIAMYCRWMVRPGPVDFGQWRAVRPDQLVLPLDVHTGRQARALGLLQREQDDWRAVHELTAACRRLDPADPCRYDFALFGLGAYGPDGFPAGSAPRDR
jgi:uncharacterized protein (TIGR02757 family)